MEEDKYLTDEELNAVAELSYSSGDFVTREHEGRIVSLVNEVREYRKMFSNPEPLEQAKNNKLIELAYWNGRLQDALSDLVKLSLESKTIRKKSAFNVAWSVMTQNPLKIAINSGIYTKLILLAYHKSVISIGKSCELLYTNHMDFRRRYADFVAELEQAEQSELEREKSIYDGY